MHLLRLYLSTPENPPVVSFAEENDQNALETNLAAAFRLLGEQANRIDTVQVSCQLSCTVAGKASMSSVHDLLHQSYNSHDLVGFLDIPVLTIYFPLMSVL